MKKAMRVLVPLVLVVAIIVSAVWYLFVYDRQFTRDMLLHQARTFEAEGNHKLASWLYDLTYIYSSNDEAIAIELAQQYKAAGNYTKAEATLSRAISDGKGSSKLYMALCKTYVEQDKLLDAVRMLENIGDPNIKAELDALRPKPPVADRTPGFYNQYIDVTVTAPAGKLYANDRGEFPTTADSAAEAAFTLGNGETTIYAVAAADNGLVSELAIFGYTVGGVVEQVEFTDEAFRDAILDLLLADDDDVIFTDRLWDITEFTMPADVTDYTDLKYLPYLKTLSIHDADADQLTKLAPLTHLETLHIMNSAPTQDELAAIAALPKLQTLSLTGCNLSSIAPLSAAAGLKYLNLTDNTIRNLAPLSSLTGLQELYLAHNALTDLSALSPLTALKQLDLSYNSITAIDALGACRELQKLNISNNRIASIDVLGNLTSLTELYASTNAFADVSKLANCILLTQLDISSNQVTDITALSPLNRLLIFNFSYNQAAALPAFSKDCALVTIDGSYNVLTDLEALRDLDNLNNVLMDYNPELESVDPLRGCPVLIQVNVYGTKVTDVSFLTDQSIIVNFNPTLEED